MIQGGTRCPGCHGSYVKVSCLPAVADDVHVRADSAYLLVRVRTQGPRLRPFAVVVSWTSWRWSGGPVSVRAVAF